MASFTLGRYQILEELGFGGMGTVYRALDPVLDREVALKTMFTHGSFEEDATRRFLREARSVARLQHPNIITIYELGEVDGKPFIAMELLDGKNLSEAVEAGLLPDLASKVRVVDQLCRGLAYAHRRGVIHRDVKPSNVFLLKDKTVKLLDFGIARVEGGTSVTDRGTIMGTPNYMAPEQFRPEGVDHRVDQWAVGVLAYELLTGQRPFDGGSVPSLIYRILHSPPPPFDPAAGQLPAPLEEIVLRAMAKEPDDRFPDLDAMATALGGVQLGPAQDESARLVMLSETVHLVMSEGEGPDASHAHQSSAPRPAPSAPALAELPAGCLAPAAPTVVAHPTLLTGQRRTGFREAGVLGERLGLQVIAVDPTERVVAVGGVDGSIRLWDLATRMKVATLRSRVHLRTGHGAMTTALAFTRDGALLAAGHLDGAVYIWDTASGLEAEVALRHDGAVAGLAFSADSTLLVSGGMDSSIKCWEMPAVMAGEARRLLRHQPAEVTALALAGERVFTAHANRVIRVQELGSGRLLATIHGHPAVPAVLAPAPHGDLLVTGSRDGSVRVFAVERRSQVRQLEGHSRPVASIAFFPDGWRVASAARDAVLQIWEVDRSEPAETLAGAPDESFASLAVLASGERLVCGLADGRLRLWERS